MLAAAYVMESNGVPDGLVGEPRNDQGRFRRFKPRQVHAGLYSIHRGLFFCIELTCGKRESMS